MHQKERIEEGTSMADGSSRRFAGTDEWLEADGLGGFASGSADGIRRRRYHALLLTAATPPTGRVVLVNGLDAEVETQAGRYALSSQRYDPGVTHPDGAGRIESFRIDPWPRWVFGLGDGTTIEHELFMPKGSPVVALSWKLRPATGKVGADAGKVALMVRPFLSGRDYHALHHENPVFRFEPTVRSEGGVAWRPYDGLPAVAARHNGAYDDAPEWYRRFLYETERERGLDEIEDLASPGVFRFDLTGGEAVLLLAAAGPAGPPLNACDAAKTLASLRAAETKRRAAFPTRLHRAADAYLVRRGSGKTIVAGYPWFTDWGRDTFIALRGLCIAAGRLDDARDILVEWSGAVSEGMLPNFFPEGTVAAEFNSVDASLWFVIAVHDFLVAANRAGWFVSPADRTSLADAVDAILAGYAAGTRFGIRRDADGLLAAGQPGVQLTWMDARVGDWVVTPRIGKPVEIQALWLNALKIGSMLSDGSEMRSRWRGMFESALENFRIRFWNDADGCLYDVVDENHEAGSVDARFRPNQILAVGGLPMPLFEGPRARQIVDAVERRLVTPLGLRSLAPGVPGYAPRYEGSPLQRDGSYHQGTVWPWLAGPFVEAWVRVRGGDEASCREARARFLEPLLAHLDTAGLGHISEIADAEPPHSPRGCPFQAWSVGEALRLQEAVLAEVRPARRAARAPRKDRRSDFGNDAGTPVARPSRPGAGREILPS